METLNSLGSLPLLAVLAAAIYSLFVAGFASFKLLKREFEFNLAELFSKTQIRKRSLFALGLATFSLLSEAVLVVTKALPEGVFIFIFLVLFPVLILCSIISIILSSFALYQRPQTLDYISALIGTLSLVLVSIWLFTPVIFS